MGSIEFGNVKRGREKTKCGDDINVIIIASIGSSKKNDDLELEFKKAKQAALFGASVITDHSFYGDINAFHKKLVDEVDCAISTVSNYEFAVNLREQRTINQTDPKIILSIIESQLKRGLDLMTLHASFKREHLSLLSKTNRVIPTTSKGGGIISNYMNMANTENPYYTYFDDILQLFYEYGACISLGTTFRPASVCDSFDELLISELETMGELCKRAIKKNVPIMIEGIGHSTLKNIPIHIALAKTICHGVPYRVLPISTDIALGFDHIAGAIATASAVMAGASAVTCISRAEHIGLPSITDLEEAIIATKIAIHSGQISKDHGLDKDFRMSNKRWKFGCKGDWRDAIDSYAAKNALEKYNISDEKEFQCTMCGAYCGIKNGKLAYDISKKVKG